MDLTKFTTEDGARGVPIILDFQNPDDILLLETQFTESDFQQKMRQHIARLKRPLDTSRTVHLLINSDRVLRFLNYIQFTKWQKAGAWNAIISGPTYSQYMKYRNNQSAQDLGLFPDDERCEVCLAIDCRGRIISFDETVFVLELSTPV